MSFQKNMDKKRTFLKLKCNQRLGSIYRTNFTVNQVHRIQKVQHVPLIRLEEKNMLINGQLKEIYEKRKKSQDFLN